MERTLMSWSIFVGSEQQVYLEQCGSPMARGEHPAVFFENDAQLWFSVKSMVVGCRL
jgi:hypothetical protein